MPAREGVASSREALLEKAKVCAGGHVVPEADEVDIVAGEELSAANRAVEEEARQPSR